MFRIFSVAVPVRIPALVISEIILLIACYLAAIGVDSDIADFESFFSYESGLARLSILIAVILLGIYFRDLYGHLRIQHRIALAQELCMVFGIAFITQGLITYIDRDLMMPRKVMIAGSLLAIVTTFGLRIMFDAAARDTSSAKRILFLGISPTIGQVAAHLNHHPELGLAAAGYLDDGSGASPQETLARLGTVRELDATLETANPACIVIGQREIVKPWWTEDFLELHFGGVQTEEVTSLYEKAFGRICGPEVKPESLIFSGAFEPEPIVTNLRNLYSPLLAALAILVISPLMIAVALAKRVSSGGRLLPADNRVGLGGKPFRMYSFNPEGFPAHRGLCALPRLFNVVAGHMALVGPRPERPVFAEVLRNAVPYYAQRHCVKPGLTGWEQVHTNWEQVPDALRQLEYDLYYIKNAAPTFDSAILILCLKKLLTGDHAAA